MDTSFYMTVCTNKSSDYHYTMQKAICLIPRIKYFGFYALKKSSTII